MSERFSDFDTMDLLDKLGKLTASMDVPEFRRRSPYWLSRNMKVRNSDHSNYSEANEVIKVLLKRGHK